MDVKRCTVCGMAIEGSDKWTPQRRNAVKYCDGCRKMMYSQNHAERLRKMRKSRTDEFNLTKDQNAVLREQNEMLRAYTAKLKEHIELLNKSNQQLRQVIRTLSKP